MDAEVAVIGAGVVGSASALALARRGASVLLLEAEDEAGLGASGTNSGIWHTGFDSPPGELETELILSSGRRRDRVLEALRVPLRRCGAVLRPLHGEQRPAVRALAANAEGNGVEVALGHDGALRVPGEAITDPVAYTLALVAAARAYGAELRTGFAVASLSRGGDGLALQSADGERVRARVVVNCAGLRADEVARRAGDDSFSIYPRKGEFLVFEPREPLEEILLPVPSKRTKGVLVFPTIDGKVVAGPTAVDQDDKDDWSVRPQAAEEIVPRAAAMHPPLDGLRPIFAYAGLRPAGRGVNYLIGASSQCRGLVNVAAIRSTGLTASLGIGERVARIVAGLGVVLRAERPLLGGEPPRLDGPWWRRTARLRVGA
ncbi:MAG TPA: FAD-dependent oxidoreductase [Thermoleophilaceae bacterium]|nr:FAD-dependent oxidoreductase [Thermoleophilaceae bacterium]